MNVTRLAPWIERQRTSHRGITSWKLTFITGEETSELVSSWTEVEIKSGSARDFADLVLGVAQDDCDCRELPETRYRLICSTTDRELSGTVIKCRPSDEQPDKLNLGSAAGNTALQQMVRMNEAMLRVVISSYGTTIEGFRSLIATQGKEIAELRALIHKQQAAYDKIIMSQVDENGDNHSAVDKLTELAEKLGPHIIAAVAREGVPSQ